MEARITADLTKGYAVRITNGRHTWVGDEPVDLDGDDLGPTPYELLVGALAACTCITLAVYCQRKGWTLDSVSVRFDFDQVHAEDCANCDEKATGFIDTIRSQVFIEGDFDEDAAARLRSVVSKCPVRKTLTNGVRFTDEDVHVG